jgi:hypothetical protein
MGISVHFVKLFLTASNYSPPNQKGAEQNQPLFLLKAKIKAAEFPSAAFSIFSLFY